ncbi:hypothetical protein GCM10023188_08810 [Pontibacter saemangeumensis]|uniref:Uncharacterized protein n=1 Tax=Pontibacter saemangeumensis TaxID=1084525 RepID=A0ABP8LDV9_9BACT
MEVLDIRSLLENIERKVCQQEITTDADVTKLINTEIAKALNLKYKKEKETQEDALKHVSCTTVTCYLEHLKNVEEKLKMPTHISAQCSLVEEREINRRLLLILNRIKGYSRK